MALHAILTAVVIACAVASYRVSVAVRRKRQSPLASLRVALPGDPELRDHRYMLLRAREVASSVTAIVLRCPEWSEDWDLAALIATETDACLSRGAFAIDEPDEVQAVEVECEAMHQLRLAFARIVSGTGSGARAARPAIESALASIGESIEDLPVSARRS